MVALPTSCAGAVVDATPIAYSIIVPLFDCRDAGTRALESALGQAFPRDRYEVIAVVDAAARSQWPNALLACCDRVVAVDADFAAVESEIALFDAGARRARGDYLYFIEGHTVLASRALAAIDAALAAAPAGALACGRRTNHSTTRLGSLIGASNDVHEERARAQGGFTLGANCVIRRSAFVSLGGFDAKFQRFNEWVLFQRARDARVPLVAIDATLCTHHNDAGFSWLIRLLVATGRAKSRYYKSLRDAGMSPHPRHPVYRWLGSAPAAALAAMPLRIAGPLLILMAMSLVRILPRVAAGIYRTGVGFTDVSGFCAERAFGQRGRLGLGPDNASDVNSTQLIGGVVGRPSAVVELERT
jgi:hypothetical protein